MIDRELLAGLRASPACHSLWLRLRFRLHMIANESMLEVQGLLPSDAKSAAGNGAAEVPRLGGMPWADDSSAYSISAVGPRRSPSFHSAEDSDALWWPPRCDMRLKTILIGTSCC